MRHESYNYKIKYEKFAVSDDLYAKTNSVITAANRVGQSENHTLQAQSGEVLPWHRRHVATKYVPPSVI